MGYGPRLSATIAQMAGGHGDSRTIIQDFCSSVLGIPISLRAIQKIIDHISSAIEPHYKRLGDVARQTEVNRMDETSFSKKGVLQWLWVMTNATVAFFMIHPHRSKEAFEALIGDLGRHPRERWLRYLLQMGWASADVSCPSDP